MTYPVRRRPDLVVPALAVARRAKRGTALVDLRSLGIVHGIAGGASGYNAVGDVITHTADGRPLNALWTEMVETIRLLKERRSGLAVLLSHPVAVPDEYVVQAISGEDFQKSSEYGEPVGLRNAPDTLRLGYKFEWYDLATRFTWRFLAEALAEQVESVHAGALEADNRMVWRMILGALLNNSNRINPEGTTVYPLWNGQVGDKPRDYLGTTFADQHQHYVTAGSTTLDAADVETVMQKVTEHGYTNTPGTRLLVFANPAEADVIRGFRAGVGTPPAKYDFIPSDGAPPYLTQETIVGERAPATFERIPLIGSYGPAWVVEEALIPVGYVLAVATSGANSPQNVVGFREHRNSALRGLQIIRGDNREYPLSGAFYLRGAGTGVRHRGAAAVLQVTASATYTAPAYFTGQG